jgi:hypothetical protein
MGMSVSPWKEENAAKEERARDKSASDKEIAALTAAAEDRERDPKVKRLVKQVEVGSAGHCSPRHIIAQTCA